MDMDLPTATFAEAWYCEVTESMKFGYFELENFMFNVPQVSVWAWLAFVPIFGWSNWWAEIEQLLPIMLYTGQRYLWVPVETTGSSLSGLAFGHHPNQS